MTFLEKIEIQHPIVQAPMAGVSTPDLAATVSNAGGLGSIAVGAMDASGARKMVNELRSKTDRPFNVNVFVHKEPSHNAFLEAAWLKALTPLFESFGAKPPKTLRTIYKSFADDDAMLSLFLEDVPPVISLSLIHI